MKIVNIMVSKRKGGMEKAFITQCAVFREMGHEVLPVIDKRFPLNFPMQPFRTMKYFPGISGILMRHAITRAKPDIIIAHGNRAADLASPLIKNHKCIVVVHNTSNVPKSLPYNNIVAVSAGLKEYMRKIIGPDKNLVHIKNMVPVPPFKKKSITGTIVAMGRLSEEKGFRHFIDALCLLKLRGHKFRAVLAGDGPIRRHLMMYAENKSLHELEFPGWVHDLTPLYDIADIICMPSAEETFGLVVIEAMAHSCPVIAADSDGPRETVKHMETGYLVPKGCAASIAAAVEHFLSSRDIYNALSRGGYDFVQKEYGIDAVKNDWNRFFLS